VPFDDDAEADHTGYRPPPHPDDRLWRHPSEMRDHPIVRVPDPLQRMTGVFVARTSGGHARWRSPWVLAGGSALAGALVTGVAVATLGLGQEVVERPVTERVALEPDVSTLDAPDAGSPSAGETTADGAQADDGSTGDDAGEPAVVAVGPAGDGAGSVAGAGAMSAEGGTSAGSVSSAGRPQGTGVLVRDDGIVVTSAALVADGMSPVVRLADGTQAAAEVVGTDVTTGIAVLDLDGAGYTPSVLAEGPGPAAGEAAFAVTAAPDGGTTTGDGVVGPARRYVGPAGTALEGIEIVGAADAAALGGPVVDGRGAVVGVVTAVAPGGAWYIAPLDVARRVTDELLATGVARHGWLGIEGTEGTDATLVASVVPDSPADDSGIEAGDRIVAVGGRSVADMAAMLVALRAHAPGDRVDVAVARPDGTQVTLVIRLREAPGDP
jgi:putative serine protease PepD